MATTLLCATATILTHPPKLSLRPIHGGLLPSKLSFSRSSSLKCKAVGDSSQTSLDPTVYQGIYGPWTVESSDVREVLY